MARAKGLVFDKKAPDGKYPSPYGSHASMIDASMNTNDPKFVILKDDDGHYVTEKSRLDNGMADPYRYSENRSKLFKEISVVYFPPIGSGIHPIWQNNSLSWPLN